MKNKSTPLGQKKSPICGDGAGEVAITVRCIPSKGSAMGAVLQESSPDRFDPDTGMILGHPGTPEQLADLEKMAEIRPVFDLIGTRQT